MWHVARRRLYNGRRITKILTLTSAQLRRRLPEYSCVQSTNQHEFLIQCNPAVHLMHFSVFIRWVYSYWNFEQSKLSVLNQACFKWMDKAIWFGVWIWIECLSACALIASSLTNETRLNAGIINKIKNYILREGENGLYDFLSMATHNLRTSKRKAGVQPWTHNG